MLLVYFSAACSTLCGRTLLYIFFYYGNALYSKNVPLSSIILAFLCSKFFEPCFSQILLFYIWILSLFDLTSSIVWGDDRSCSEPMHDLVSFVRFLLQVWRAWSLMFAFGPNMVALPRLAIGWHRRWLRWIWRFIPRTRNLRRAGLSMLFTSSSIC